MADETTDPAKAMRPPETPKFSMEDEPETGWDTAPHDIADPKMKRHPRTGGKGATPDVGEEPTKS